MTHLGIIVILAVFSCVAGQEYTYANALRDSLLFYEAERSGTLPDSNRVSWRGNSALEDGQDRGMDLTGGWYDAGDHVKFGFPMAWSTTTTAWGVWEFRAGFEAAGEYTNALDSIRWPLDYFLKCIVSDDGTKVTEFVGQVADGYADHAEWTRPESMTTYRPSFTISTTSPGSDLAGETAAALAAGSLAFRESDSGYADTLLDAARKLHEFAIADQGIYTAAIPADDFYGSTGFNDELAWSAIWLYLATNEQIYMDRALQYYSSGLPWAYSWDSKDAGVQLLMFKATGDDQYAGHVRAFLDSWGPSGGITYTPGGLAWRDQWGPLRYTGNTAAIAMLAAKEGIDSQGRIDWAKGQIDYMLYNNPMGISYIIKADGYKPEKPHHRGASCNPDHSVPCNWDDYNTAEDNDSDLIGALVGGPDQNDQYTDDRGDYISNEVANDYNAGFQTALAGLVEAQAQGKL